MGYGDEKKLQASLARLSLKDKRHKDESKERMASVRGFSSQYQTNYQPLEFGVRKKLWQEGFYYRSIRKEAGFKHTKFEWKMLSDRSSYIPSGRKSGQHGKQSCSVALASLKDSSCLEPLNLPPTKLEKKRLKLMKMYERQKQKQELAKKRPQTAHPVAFSSDNNSRTQKEVRRGSDGEFGVYKLTSYERNKRNNMKSNVTLPTESLVDTASLVSEEDRLKQLESASNIRTEKESTNATNAQSDAAVVGSPEKRDVEAEVQTSARGSRYSNPKAGPNMNKKS